MTRERIRESMITPLDIQNKEFSRSVRGYKEEEVDGFLDLLTVDMEKLLAENAALKADVARLSVEVDKYKNAEDAVLETLEAAKALMGDISASAEKRAEILLKNAELDAELILREAKESSERLTEESIHLKHRFSAFQSKYKGLLESELERFDTLSVEIFEEFSIDEQLEEVKPPSRERTVKSQTLALSRKPYDDLSQTMVNIRTGDGA